MFCNNCGNQLPENAAFCNVCGAAVTTAIENTCPNCGNKLPDSAAFCNLCGARCGAVPEPAGIPTYNAANTAADIEYNYRRGMGCLQADAKPTALSYFLKAAELGHMESQYQAANMLNHGGGVVRDRAQAAYWYYKAATQGHSGAQYELALQYIVGANAGVQKNFSIAARWLRLSAEQNYINTLLLLGFLHDPMELNSTKREASEENISIPYDINKATEYYTKAVENGSETAFIYLARLRMYMRFMECQRLNVPISGTNMAAMLFQELLPLFDDDTKDVSAIGVSELFQKKLNGALKYAFLGVNEVPLLIIDTSLGGSGKNGLLLTTQALHFKDTTEKAVMFDFDSQPVLTVRKEEYFYRIFLNGKPIMLFQKEKRSAERLVCIIKCLSTGFKYINKVFNYSP